jgi:hypothetical protein
MLRQQLLKGGTMDSVYDTVKRQLSELPRDTKNSAIVEENLAYLRSLVSQNVPSRLIQEVLDSEELLEIISARSYHHVNHFDKIVVVDSEDPLSYRLTLHYWPGAYDTRVMNQELIHNHRFSFWSHIFRGTLRMENYAEAPMIGVGQQVLRRYVYRPTVVGNIHSCEFDGEARLEKKDDTAYPQGECYYLHYLATHRVTLPEGNSRICTMVLRGPREREYTNTYNTFYPEQGMESSVPTMEPVVLERKLREILEECSV